MGSEAAITVILRAHAYARDPLAPRLGALKMNVTFMYGATDWMSRETADNLVAEKVVCGQVVEVSNSGHDLYLENPEECAKCLLKLI